MGIVESNCPRFSKALFTWFSRKSRLWFGCLGVKPMKHSGVLGPYPWNRDRRRFFYSWKSSRRGPHNWLQRDRVELFTLGVHVHMQLRRTDPGFTHHAINTLKTRRTVFTFEIRTSSLMLSIQQPYCCTSSHTVAENILFVDGISLIFFVDIDSKLRESYI